MKKKIKKIKLTVVTILLIVIICLTCCRSSRLEFPRLPYTEKEVLENGDVKAYGSGGEILFEYHAETDTVEIPFWYWQKIMFYGINKNGI